tara:strand:- start:3312 stop:3521 length:210 start_codon:yes stop_codon:yes gene_type:complete
MDLDIGVNVTLNEKGKYCSIDNNKHLKPNEVGTIIDVVHYDKAVNDYIYVVQTSDRKTDYWYGFHLKSI